MIKHDYLCSHSNMKREARGTLDKAFVINLQRVFLQEDTMLLQDHLDLKLKYGIIRFREDVCDWVKEKNSFKPAF